MPKASSGKRTRQCIESAIEHFRSNRHLFEGFANSLIGYFQNDAALAACTHFLTHRIKHPDHLREKLFRKAGQGELIDAATLFHRITDLAGIRIVHLHTDQFPAIHEAIQRILQEQRLRLVEPATANVWDVELATYFESVGIATQSRVSMYSTVHYVIEANQRTRVTCEVQVRTLMDEVWGEVSHRVNYPEQSQSRSCQDQLKVLARLTTGCTRLVDSIFRSHQDTTQPET